jgi:hypothetical protein
MCGICQKKSAKIRVICIIRAPFKRDDPNNPLQLTAGGFGVINVFGVAAGFGLSSVFRQNPAATELFRYTAKDETEYFCTSRNLSSHLLTLTGARLANVGTAALAVIYKSTLKEEKS